MGKNKKPFIDRKSAVNYTLTNRELEETQRTSDRKSVANFRPFDKHFEGIYEGYANEAEEMDDGEGPIETDPALFSSLLADGQSQRSCEERFHRELPDTELKGAVLRYAKAMEIGKGRAESTEQILVDNAKRNRWDCESILSIHSNIYNHPTEIREPMKGIGRRKGRTTTNEKGLSKLQEMEIDDQCDGPPVPSVRTRISIISAIRPKGETTEERRMRKSAVKEERRERRKEKKTNKESFRVERLKLDEQQRTNQPKTRQIH
ncbi:hypothetical protein niasHS_015957 [Heterodera schachtii]|uniref:Protein LTV1 homolog n=2 Tax=Heterodera TaxID=34509 RepID=A0ABD2I992_HETSC